MNDSHPQSTAAQSRCSEAPGSVLKPGDTIQPGDKWWDDHDKRWAPIHPRSVRVHTTVRPGERILRPNTEVTGAKRPVE